MNSPAKTEQVLVSQEGSTGRIRLNRPAALNSLTLEMVRGIAAALDRFQRDRSVATVLITGEGERAFCAGGDVRAIYESLSSGPDLAEIFWREEYILNARMAEYPKPYIAIMDGITMGGGIGASAHGSHRIVTERTRVAMPECSIGFFPDVGATWLLTRSPGEVGTYLGLTGNSIGASDAIYARLADVCVPSGKLPDVIAALQKLPASAGAADVTRLVEAYALPLEATPMQINRADIDRIFGADDVEGILAGLEKTQTEFAQATLATLRTKSPTSLKLTLRLLRLGRTSPNLRACLEREFVVCHAIIDKPDFREGIRAAVIDKDRNPRWSPDRLDRVGDLADYFAKTPAPLFAAR